LRLIRILAVFIVIGASAAASPLAAQDWYFTAAFGADWSGATSFRDRDCAATSPPALFGCGAGEDGDRPLGAYGDFGASSAMEVGLGAAFSAVRLEARLAYRPSLAFTGSANFLNASRTQPVRGEVRSVAVAIAGALDLPGADLGYSRLRPFVGASAGLARHEVERVVFRFPALGGGARTEIPGGTNYPFTWTGTAGLAFEIDERITVDAAYRYGNLGEIETEPGQARIVRRGVDTTIQIDGTRAKLETHGFVAGLRIGL